MTAYLLADLNDLSTRTLNESAQAEDCRVNLVAPLFGYLLPHQARRTY